MFLSNKQIFQAENSKVKAFHNVNLLPFHLNKVRTQLNTDLLGVILTLLKLLVKAFCLGSIFLLAQGKAFQGHSCIIYTTCMFCRLGARGSSLCRIIYFGSFFIMAEHKDAQRWLLF